MALRCGANLASGELGLAAELSVSKIILRSIDTGEVFSREWNTVTVDPVIEPYHVVVAAVLIDSCLFLRQIVHTSIDPQN